MSQLYNTFYFKCTFLSDVILNARSATAQTSEWLPYIPGSKFLGLAAKALYAEHGEHFHNGNLRFGDAHPASQDRRSLKIPLSYFYGKNDEKGNIYLKHLLSNEDDEKLRKQGIQIKQMRKGYFVPGAGQSVSPRARMTLKSAYDADKRCSKDGQLFAYTALPKGSVWIFSVQIEQSISLEEAVIASLVGERSLGKSRSAQYGRVLIERLEDFKEEYNSSSEEEQSEQVVLYAESDWCFLDDLGSFTAQPCPQKHLGLPKGAEICWEKSQVRTRYYAPWNGHRANRDADRWVIEKGSVLVVKNAGAVQPAQFEQGIGLFKAEGLGKVLVNPFFLQQNKNQTITIKNEGKQDTGTKLTSDTPQALPGDAAFLEFIKKRAERENPKVSLAAKVNVFIDSYEKKLKEANISASQWGQVRNLAMHIKNPKLLMLMLFDKNIGFVYTAKRKQAWSKIAPLFESVCKSWADEDSERYAFIELLCTEMAKFKNSFTPQNQG